jgi:hypothetical protein
MLDRHRQPWKLVRACTISLLSGLLLTYILLFSVPGVSAASTGTIGILGPTSGPVDALVTLEIRQYPSVATKYTLAATTMSPDQGGCGSAQSLSGVAPFQVDPNRGADVQFHWPASIGRGTYWFCATSMNGSAPAAMSLPSAPYTVLTSAAPTLQVDMSTSVARPGATIIVHLANWRTSDSGAPSRIVLLRQGAPLDSAITLALQTTGSGDSSGNYTLTATLPTFIATSGQDVVVVQGECGSDPLGTGKNVCAVTEQSSGFAVAQSPAPTSVATSAATSSAQTSPGSGQDDGSNVGVSWIAPVIGLILLAIIVGLVVVLVRRAGARKRQAQAARYRRERDPVYWRDDQRYDSRYDQRYDSRSRR